MAFRQHLIGFLSFFSIFLIFYAFSINEFYRKLHYTVPKVEINKNYPSFNKSSDPIIITHATDIHVSHLHPRTYYRLNKTLNFWEKMIKPVFAVLSGDLTDNYSHKKSPCYAYPIEKHNIYNDTITNSGLNLDRLFEIFGNHDLFGVYDWDDNKSYASIYTKTKRSSFHAFSQVRNGVKLIGFVPCEIPFGNGPQQVVATMRTKYLDELERELQQKSDAKYVIIVCHFTHEFIYPLRARSTSGKTYEDLIREYNVTCLLTGHVHPKKLEFVHYANTMELTMMSMKKCDFFALLSLDNGRINYELHSFNDSQISLITYPDLMKLLLNNSKFDQESIQSSVIKLLNDHNPNEFALMELFDKLQSMDNLVINGMPLLIFVIQKFSIKLTRFLISKGINVMTCYQGIPALMNILSKYDIKYYEDLLSSIDLKQRNKDFTPFKVDYKYPIQNTIRYCIAKDNIDLLDFINYYLNDNTVLELSLIHI